MTKKSEESFQALTRLAEQAFDEAAQSVIDRAIAAGTPLILWENGQIKQVDPNAYRLPKSKVKKPRR